MPEYPPNVPWILNVAYVKARDWMFKLRWSPNYADSLQQPYMEVWVGYDVIWTSSPFMKRKLEKREQNEDQPVCNNQTLSLRVTKKRTDRVGRDFPSHFGISIHAE